MAFWKKSEDPWDPDPAARKRAPASTETAAPDGMRCPWCGGAMLRGYLDAVSGGEIWWTAGLPNPKANLLGADPKQSLLVSDEGVFFTYKTAWHCRKCEKMVLDAQGIRRPYATAFDEEKANKGE